MSSKKSSGKWWTIAGLSLLALFTFRSSSKASPASQTTPLPSQGRTPDQIRSVIKNVLMTYGYGAQMAENWYLVAKMETAGFTSNLFRKYNNMFGMHQPTQRRTTSLGGVWSEAEKADMATFNDPESAAVDLVYYMQAKRYPIDFNSLESQLEFMKSKGYFTIPYARYLDLVLAWSKR